jgi:hypothetical protein
MSLARRFAGTGARRVRGAGGGRPDPVSQILSAYAGAGWAVPFLFLARASDVSLVSGAVETWVNKGTAGNATQGTGTARPAYSESSFNSRPGLTFDTGDLLATSAVNLAAFTALVQHVVFLDTAAGISIVIERSASAGGTDGGTYFTVNEVAGTVRMLGRGNALNSIVDSSAETMAAGHVITGSYDQALATNETEIRRDGVNFTNARTSNNNTSGGLGNHALFIGARSGIALGLAGTIAAVVIAVGTTAVPLAAVAAAEAALRAQWGTP